MSETVAQYAATGLHESPEPSTGAQIRELRKARSLVLKDLAARCGCSVGYLSQVERGLSEISLSSLDRIARALQVPLAWFFQTDSAAFATTPQSGYLVRRDQRRLLSYTGSGVREEMLSPNLRGEGLMILTHTEPGADGGEALQRPVEESGLVLKGQLNLRIGDEWLHLQCGDSFQIPRGLSHEFNNPGPEVNEVVWFITPANY